MAGGDCEASSGEPNFQHGLRARENRAHVAQVDALNPLQQRILHRSAIHDSRNHPPFAVEVGDRRVRRGGRRSHRGGRSRLRFELHRLPGRPFERFEREAAAVLSRKPGWSRRAARGDTQLPRAPLQFIDPPVRIARFRPHVEYHIDASWFGSGIQLDRASVD